MKTLTPAQGRFATRLFNTKGVTQERLAKMFGVSEATVRQTIWAQTAKGGRMDDGADLTGLTPQQRKLVAIIQRHTHKMVVAELAQLDLPIRTAMAAIMTRVDDALATFTQRIDQGIERAEAETKHHVGMMT